MKTVFIKGGSPLNGTIKAQGDKIVSVHILLATLFLKSCLQIDNLSNCGDVKSILTWLTKNKLVTVEYIKDGLILRANQSNINNILDIGYQRSSICLITPLSLLYKHVVFKNPGGCSFTSRPIDQHISLAKAFGCEIDTQQSKYIARYNDQGLSEFVFDCGTKFGTSVGVTVHAIFSAVVISVPCTFYNISLEPTIISILQLFSASKQIYYHLDDRLLTILPTNVAPQTMIHHKIPTDFSAISYFIFSSLLSKGIIKISHCTPLPQWWALLEDIIGFNTEEKNDCYVFVPKLRTVINEIKCNVWPALPSDIGPLFALLPGCFKNQIIILDEVYSSRSSHIKGLKKLGYNLNSVNNRVYINGPKQAIDETALVEVSVPDIRAGAALLVAAINRNGITKLTDFQIIERGFVSIEDTLNRLGVQFYATIS